MTHVEQLLEQWRQVASNFEDMAAREQIGPYRVICNTKKDVLRSCADELESAIQRDKEQSNG